jgi:cysteine synthase
MKSDLEKALANVPVINLKSFKENSVNALMEKYNICGSVKAKAVYWMLKTAVENNQLDTSKIVLEASSGNTAISLAYFSKLF